MNDALQGIALDPKSPLRGKRILFLGSSVTYGVEPGGISFVEFLAARTGCFARKEAVSGTTLCDVDDQSYVARLRRLDPDLTFDAALVQLSTNDVGRGHPLGTPIGPGAVGYDPSTVAGAIETIVDRIFRVYRCPVFFYVGTRFPEPRYGAMVELLWNIAKRWGIGVVDLWNDPVMNAVDPADRDRFMADGVHPTLTGYVEWWGPRIEAALIRLLGEAASR
ncbi:MAG: SGNH/GDSL hydrolase family protein [Candidatus Izemoplasmatales bacterium]